MGLRAVGWYRMNANASFPNVLEVKHKEKTAN